MSSSDLLESDIENDSVVDGSTASPSRIFILRPIATILMMVALLLSGLFAYKLLSISALPEVDYPTIRVSTYYAGASPDVMASLVTAPLEKQFGQMMGLNQMTSSSSGGASIVTLKFGLDIGLDVAEQEVQAAINAASTYLPADLPNPPIYNKVNPADPPILTIAMTSKTMPLPKVEDFAETRFSQKISQISGVGLVTISGGQRPAVRIQCNPNALSSYGLTMEDVRSVLLTTSINQPKGNFDGPLQSYVINSNDQLYTPLEYKNVILSYQNGAPVRLSDVATVIDGAEDVMQAAWVNNEPAIILNIQRQPGANVIEVVDRIKTLIDHLSGSLPGDMKLSILTDRTITIRASVSDAEFDMMISILLVIFVVFVFLRNFSATIIPSVAIPLSLVGTFGVMYLLGFSLNNLTLMALTIATGFVVDDAIVMIENITRYIEAGEPPLQAALKGAKQIGFTIISLTISLIAVLIPLLFMGDIVGRLFREFAITLSIAILLSAFVSLTLTPMMCARLITHRPVNQTSRFERFSGRVIDNLIHQYDKSLVVVLKAQSLVLWGFVVTLILTAVLFYVIPKGFFPIQDTGLIQCITEGPQSTSFTAMVKDQKTLVKALLEDPDVDHLSSFVGIDGINTSLNTGRLVINLKSMEERHGSIMEIMDRLKKRVEGYTTTLYMQPIQDLSIDDRVTRNQYQYSINGPDHVEVERWTKKLMSRLQKNPIFTDVDSDQLNLGRQAYITIDRDSASRLSITAQQIDNTLYDSFGQRQALTLFTNINQYHVILEVLPKLQESQMDLDNLYLKSSTGLPIPLSAFTSVTEKLGPLVVNRQGQFPVSTLSFNLSPDASLGEAIKVIDGMKRDMGIPESLQTSFEGAAKIFEGSLSNEGWLIVAAIIVVYIVLGILYESYIHPITILSTLPSAGIGALLALLLFGRELTIIAIIGILLLIGIVKKNAIMMVDFALEQERDYGKGPEEAIYEACLLRFRPILMTTLSALLGAIPLAFSFGTGSELRQPLGICIIGGLMLSQLLTLYTTPVIYLAFDRLSRRTSALWQRWFGGSEPVLETP